MIKENLIVECITPKGKDFNFDITVGKTYNASVIWEDKEKNIASVHLFNDKGEKELFALKPFFKIVQ